MKRTALVVLWAFGLTFVFLFLCCVVAGVASAITLKGDAKQNQVAANEAGQRWALPIFFGSMLAAVAISTCGLLPGTGRLPAVTDESGMHPGLRNVAGYHTSTGGGSLAGSDFVEVQPTIAVPLGTPEDPPPEFAALGPPLATHAPGMVASLSGFARLGVAVFGLGLLFAPVIVVDALGRDQLPQSARSILFIAGIVTGLTCLLIAIWPGSRYTYWVHDDALVVSDRKTMRIIFWDQIQALLQELPLRRDFTLVTCDGQKVPIENVRGYHQLIDTLFIRVRENLLPLMLRKACAGQMVEFGKLGVSSDAVSYKGKIVPWDEVTKLIILTGSGFRKLMIYRRGGFLSFWPFCQLNLITLPNDLMLLELLKEIAPPRLLVPAAARW